MPLRVEETTYGVPDWGVGTLWTRAGVVLAHEFAYTEVPGPSREPPASARAQEIVARLRAYFVGEDTLADVVLDLGSSTPFQRAVTQALREVPRGEVVTYGELAALAGYPGAQRAVGTFCAGNRFSLIVPCHRVVSSQGIGGYGSTGVAVKRRLLALEGVTL